MPRVDMIGVTCENAPNLGSYVLKGEPLVRRHDWPMSLYALCDVWTLDHYTILHGGDKRVGYSGVVHKGAV